MNPGYWRRSAGYPLLDIEQNKWNGHRLRACLSHKKTSIVVDHPVHPDATEALEQQITMLGDRSVGV
ncbi:MAG TPA: hypothetical protein VMU69_17670 [Bradyrhizobium sp.]|nr:hypothetical protein [Bradyrhizobium sp.]